MALPPWAVDLWAQAQPFADRLAVWRGYEQDLQTLLIYAVGIAGYTALVFAFYQQISRRRAFRVESGEGFSGFLKRTFTSIIVFPLMSFLYFGVLSISLFVLAKSGQTTYQILLLGMSVIVGVRVTSFVSESAAVDLAKMLPLALLGVLIVDPSYASLDNTWARLGELPDLLPLLGRFFLAFIVLENALQIGRTIVRKAQARKEAAAARGLLPKRLQKAQLLDEVSRRVPLESHKDAPKRRP